MNRDSPPGGARLHLKRLALLLIALALVFGGVMAFAAYKTRLVSRFAAANALQPATVSTITAQVQSWQPQVQAIGSLRAGKAVDLSAEIGGTVRELNLVSGQAVRAGATLLRMNADQELADLDAKRAARDLAAAVLERDRAQFEAQAISRAQLDADMADLAAKEAQVQSQLALIAKKTLRAPFAGRLGISTVAPGHFVSPGEKIVTLQSLDPLLVDFTLPQQRAPGLAAGQAVQLAVDAFPGRRFEARITAIDPGIDPATRNVRVEARVANPRHELMPGMFAAVTLQLGPPANLITLPSAALAFGPAGASLFVVEQGGTKGPAGAGLTARQRAVTTGETRGDQVAVLAGVQAGEAVVTSGMLKLRNGAPIVIDNRVQPPDAAAPRVQEQ